MALVEFKVLKDIAEARQLWELFSPHEVIDDEWDFRDIWTRELEFPFHFIVGYEQGKPIGLLPLQLNTLNGLGQRLLKMSEPFLEIFGGIDTDDNGVWIAPGYERYVPEFFGQIKQPAYLTSLKGKQFGSFEAEHYLDRFELDLGQFENFDDFLLKHFDGVSRQRLKNRINKIQKSYEVEIKEGNEEDLEVLFELSRQRFGEKSSFHMVQRRNVYKEMLKALEVDFFVIKIDGEPKAASFCIIYKDSYVSINIGYDLNIRDLSKYIVVTQLQRAFAMGAKRFDAGQGNNGWKEHFKFEAVPQYKLVLNCAPEEI